jgi:1-deoxy-D-xylulose-5-phosphate synthase
MMYKLLDGINSPDDLKKIESKDIPCLCSEIRAFLVENVEKQGGHLASNLGVTELTVALHRIFNSPTDHIIFDVGHQSYVHKLLTGRKNSFSTLRKTGGLSGFTSMRESPHDAFGAGHSSTSISAALGFAESEKLKGSDTYTIAVIGDGAYTGGMVHEALNNCSPDLKLIIILNENGMSISLNKGTFASYLTRVRTSKGYRGWKSGTKSVLRHIPILGKPLTSLFTFIKERFKNLFLSPNYFEDLGLYYIGPVDGNDYKKVEAALSEAKNLGKCTVVHIKTTKGKGYEPAEKSPDGFHSVYRDAKKVQTFHGEAVKYLIDEAERDESVVAITAAMGMGTGLDRFGNKYPKRYFDVGIAEAHALTFSAGLAANGMKPFIAVYSTFLQRGYDSVIHDICMQDLPVKILIDRASLALSDGATHHGIFDVAFLSHIPSMKILAPITYQSLKSAIKEALDSTAPIAIRYPNSSENKRVVDMFYSDGESLDFGVRANFLPSDTPEYAFITYGSLINNVIEAADILYGKGIKVGIILLERLKPYDDLARSVRPYISASRKIIFAEEGIKNGGAAMLLKSALEDIGLELSDKYEIIAIDDNFAAPAESCELYEYLGLSPKRLSEKILRYTT